MNGRRLILMRHAKSAWDTGAASDHARPLSERGRRDAPRIGQRLLCLGWKPDRVVLSDALRTRQTLEYLFGEETDTLDVALEPQLYLGGIDEIRDTLLEQDDAYQTVLILGHNPGWEDALGWLTGTHERLTTANAALMTSSVATWRDAVAAPERFALSTILRPKDFGG